VNDKYKILIVEDNIEDAELVIRKLGESEGVYDYKWVSSREEFLELLNLKSYSPNLLLCDYSLPSLLAPETIGIFKNFFPDVPIIVVSGTVGEDIAVETIKTEAMDKTIELFAVRRNKEEFPIELSLAAIREKDSWSALESSGILLNERKRKQNSIIIDCIWSSLLKIVLQS